MERAFLSSQYGNAPIVETSSVNLDLVDLTAHDGAMTVHYAGYQMLLFAPVFLASLGLLYLTLLGRGKDRPAAIVLLAGTLAVPLVQVGVLYQGSALGWIRYSIVIIPFGIISLGPIAKRLTGIAPRALVVAALLSIITLGNAGTYLVMVGDSDYHRTGPLTTCEEVDRIVAFLDARPDDLVLADTFLTTSAVVLRVDDPQQIVIPSDRDFYEPLAHAQGKLDHILVPRAQGASALDAVTRAYPELWAGNLPWAELAAEVPGGREWRIYRVKSPS